MTGFINPADPHRRHKIVAAAIAVVTIVCLLALVVIIAREQVTGSVIALDQARDADDPAIERAALESLVRDDPHDATALEELANLARDQGRWIEAANHWAQIAKLDPLHADARFERARNLLAAGDARAAIGVLTENGRAPSLREQLLLARAWLMQGDVEPAREALARALLDQPEDPAARLMRADIDFIQGNNDLALAGYQALLDHPQQRAAAQLGLAQIALRRGEDALALERLQAIDDPSDFQLLRARASLYQQMRRLDLAEADLRTLIERYGPKPDAVVPLAELRAAAADIDGVRALRYSLTGTDTAALAARHYLQAIEAYLQEDLGAARDYLGWSGDFFGGRDLYRWMQIDIGAQLGDAALASIGTRSLQRSVIGEARLVRTASLLTGQAAEQINAGNIATARVLATLALELVPNLDAATIVLARVALLDRKPEQARELAQALVDNQTYGNAALEVLGRAALAVGDVQQAQAQFDALAAAAPESATSAYWQGVAALEAGDSASSADYLRQAYRRRADPRIESALVDVLIRRQAWADAEIIARQVIAQPQPIDQARGYALLGGVLRAQDRTEEAADAYTTAASTDPQLYPYALAAADLLMDLERFDEADALLDTAAKRYPDNRYIAFKRALLAQRAGRDQDAVERYRAVLRATADWALPMVNLSELLSTDEATRMEAVNIAARAAELSPNWVDAHWNLAQREADIGADAEALAAARQVLELDLTHEGARAMVARLDRAP